MNFGRMRQAGHVEPTGKMFTEFQPEDLKLGLRVEIIFILKGFYIFHSVPFISVTLI